MEFILKKYHRDTPDNKLLEDIQDVYKKTNLPMSKQLYAKYGSYGTTTIIHRFGGLVKACELANVPYIEYKNTKISREDLLENIANIWIQKGSQPSINDLTKYNSKYSIRPYYTEFKTWMNALEAFVLWVNNNDSSISIDKELQNKEIKHSTSRDINLRLRFLVLQRDNFKCCMCGASPAKDPSVLLHIDHILPWSKGGETTLDNLQTLCSKCNIGKMDLL